MQERGGSGGLAQASSGSLKRPLDSQQDLSEFCRLLREDANLDSNFAKRHGSTGAPPEPIVLAFSSEGPPQVLGEQQKTTDSAREGGGDAASTRPASPEAAHGCGVPAGTTAQDPAAYLNGKPSSKPENQGDSMERSSGRLQGQRDGGSCGKVRKARRHSTARTVGAGEPRRPWRAAPPPFAGPAFHAAPLHPPCLSERGRYWVAAFRQELAEDAAVAPGDAPALLAEYAAELAQEEQFAHPATAAAHPRLNARGRQ